MYRLSKWQLINGVSLLVDNLFLNNKIAHKKSNIIYTFVMFDSLERKMRHAKLTFSASYIGFFFFKALVEPNGYFLINRIFLWFKIKI